MSEDISQTVEKTLQKNMALLDDLKPIVKKETYKSWLAMIPDAIQPPKKIFQSEGFSLADQLIGRSGPFIEVAGPTLDGYFMADFDKLDRHVITSNIVAGLPIYDPDNGQIRKIIGKVDFKANANCLPIKASSVGAVFVSCPPSSTIRPERIVGEVKRVLEPGGIFVAQKVDSVMILAAQNNGLKLQSKYQYPDLGSHIPVFDAAFQREK
jgi:hypothetical protein